VSPSRLPWLSHRPQVSLDRLAGRILSGCCRRCAARSCTLRWRRGLLQEARRAFLEFAGIGGRGLMLISRLQRLCPPTPSEFRSARQACPFQDQADDRRCRCSGPASSFCQHPPGACGRPVTKHQKDKGGFCGRFRRLWDVLLGGHAAQHSIQILVILSKCLNPLEIC